MRSSLMQGSRFATTALVVFCVGSASVLVLEIAERNHLISELTESISRLGICLVLLTMLVLTSRSLARAARWGVVVCAGFVAAELALEVVEDIDYLDPLPLIGRDSRWRHTVEKTVVSCWTCGAFYLLFILMRQSEGYLRELTERETHLQEANANLERTLAELKSAHNQVVQQERIAALGHMASGIAHDLNNALTPVMALVGQVEAESSPERRREA